MWKIVAGLFCPSLEGRESKQWIQVARGSFVTKSCLTGEQTDLGGGGFSFTEDF